MIINLNEINKWILLIKQWNLLNHIFCLPIFYFHPSRFWESYKELSSKEKILQFFCYCAIFALIVWLCFIKNVENSELIKIVSIEILAIIPYFIIVSLATFLSLKKVDFIICFVQCCYTKFLIVPFQIILLRFFIVTESYIFMSISILITFIAELFMLLLPIVNIQKSLRNISIYTISVFILLNLYDSIFIFSDMDFPKNKNIRDYITEERFTLGCSLNNAYLYPYIVCSSDKYKNNDYIYSTPNGSTTNGIQISKEVYMQELKQDLDTLRLIQDRCIFETNKEIFRSIYQAKMEILNTHKYNLFLNNSILKETIILSQDSIEIDKLQYRLFNEQISSYINKLYEEEIRLSEQYLSSLKIAQIGFLWHPLQWLVQHYHKK